MSKDRETQETEKAKEMELQMSDIDPSFKYEVSKLPGAEKVLLCFQCGTCTADCPIARFSNFYRPRKLIRMVQLGLKNKLLSNDVIWLCSTCYTCIDHCPQEVGIASIVRALRNLTVEKEAMPVAYRELASNVLKTGYAYAITELRLKKRVEDGLPPLPRADIESITKLSEATGLSKTLSKAGT